MGPHCETHGIIFYTWEAKITQDRVGAIINQHVGLEQNMTCCQHGVYGLTSRATYSFQIAVDNVMRVKVNKPQRDAMKLQVQGENKRRRESDTRNTYNLQSVAVWMFLKVVSSIPIFKVWHCDKWPVVQDVCTKKLYKKSVKISYQMQSINCRITNNIGMSNLWPYLVLAVIMLSFQNDRCLTLISLRIACVGRRQCHICQDTLAVQRTVELGVIPSFVMSTLSAIFVWFQHPINTFPLPKYISLVGNIDASK